MSEKIYTGADDADLCPVVIPTPRAHAPNVLGWLKGAAQDAPPAVRYYLVAAKWDDDLRDRAQIAAEVPVEIAKRAQEPVKPAVWWSIDSTGRPCAWPVVAEAPRG